jgi:hypothetical protein
MSRFYITELHGDLTMRTGHPSKSVGVSFHILDRLWNHRLIATYRSEDFLGWRYTHEHGRRMARARAHAHLARLTAS